MSAQTAVAEIRTAESKRPVGRRQLSVLSRMTLLLAVTVFAATVVFFFVQRGLSSQLDILVREHVTETTHVLHRILDLRASGASIHADDYSRWDDFMAFARKPDPVWGKLYLTESIGTFAIDVAWVLDDHFRLIFTANPKGDPAMAPIPVRETALVIALSEKPIRHFFATTPRGVLELWTSSIQPSSDFARVTPPAGYYIVGRLWTPARIAELAALMDGTMALTATQARVPVSTASSETGEIRIALPFADIRGAEVAVLDYATTYPAAPRVHGALHQVMLLMIAGSLVLFVLVSLALSRWVAQPLALITASLRNENPSLLYRTMARDDEFGRLARLVRDFFAQRGHLIEAREATEVAARAKQQFLANISHELRTPMHGILSFSRFGVEDAAAGPREELLDYFQQIGMCGGTLLALLDDLLDLAKFDAGRMKLAFADLALEEVAQDAVDEFATLYEERHLTLDVQTESGLPSVKGDSNRLRQVLRNLLSNAGKFTSPGGKVVVRVERAGDMARVTVEDQGKGIPAGELETVFDRFSQASNNATGAGGTGLGLPLCREIVQSHGGRIWAEQGSPGGTRMIFEVPFSGPGVAVNPEPGKAAA